MRPLGVERAHTSEPSSLLDHIDVPTQSAPGSAQTPAVPAKVDVGELVDKVTQGQPVDVPVPPPADVPTPPAANDAQAPAPSTVSVPASDVPVPLAPAANDAPASGAAPATDK